MPIDIAGEGEAIFPSPKFIPTMNNITFFTLLVISFLLFSCDNDPLIVESNQPPVIVVRGVVYDGLPLFVFVAKAVPQLTGLIDYSLPGAAVTLEVDESQVIPLYELASDDPQLGRGNFSFRGTWYRSALPIHLAEGSTYTIQATADGFDTVRSEQLTFNRIVEIDTFVGIDGYVGEVDEDWNDFVDINLSGELNYNDDGELSIAVVIGGQTDSLFSRRGRSASYDSQGRDLTIINNPTRGDFSIDFVHEHRIGRKYKPDTERYFIEFTYFRREYINFYESFFLRSNFDDFSGLYANIQPIETNIINGLGYFSLAERYTYEILP